MRSLTLPILCLLLAGCGTIGTTRSMLSMPEFQQENLPRRELRVVILSPDKRRVPAIRTLLQEGSEALSDQVGITLLEQDYKPIEWESRDMDKMLGQVAGIMKTYDKPYDLAIAFQDFSVLQLLQYSLVGAWEGVIDDTYRRFIIIKKMDTEALIHEICHAFLFSTVHSRALMAPLTIYLVPGVISLNRSIYLIPKDRKEILANKWRDFSIAPDLSASNKPNALTVSSVKQ